VRQSGRFCNRGRIANMNLNGLKIDQSCPLCTAGHAFVHWSAFRDAFVSLTTRSFQCPLCLTSIQGVDKFALHLVSHDLRNKMQVQEMLVGSAHTAPSNHPDYHHGCHGHHSMVPSHHHPPSALLKHGPTVVAPPPMQMATNNSEEEQPRTVTHFMIGDKDPIDKGSSYGHQMEAAMFKPAPMVVAPPPLMSANQPNSHITLSGMEQVNSIPQLSIKENVANVPTHNGKGWTLSGFFN